RDRPHAAVSPGALFHLVPSQAEGMREVDLQLVASALADPTRFRAFELICSCETITSQGLAEIRGLSPATISHHLCQLRVASLIESVRSGRWRLHKARREPLAAYVEALAAL